MTTPHQIGPYRIQTEIGRGGMAVVYRAVDARTGAVVALKVLPPHLAHDERYLQRFEREGKSAARLRHPNIVRTLETGADDGSHYLAMEYVEGQTLADLLRAQRTLLPPADVVEIIRQIAGALDYAHNLGVLHRDIKTSNIMIDRDGRALLMDFGVAKLVDEDHTAYTIVGTTVGTPAFMAPEQARGGEVDRRADIYSLGVIAYSLFTGVMPFKADSQPALLHKIVYEPPLQPEEVNQTLPPGVIYALKKVLAKSPSARYPTAGDFAQALAKGLTWAPSSGELRAVQERMLVTTGSQSQVAVATPPKRSTRGALLLGLGALVATIAAVVLFLYPPEWLAGGVAPPQNVAIAVTLDAFQPREGAFRLKVPDAWTPGSATDAQGIVYTFDAPDRMARLFAVQLAKPPASNDSDAARQAVALYLASGALPYTGVTVTTPGALRQHAELSIYEQSANAEWLGQPVVLQISAVAGAAATYLVGLVVETPQAATFEPLRQSVVDSLDIDLSPISQLLPTVTDTPADAAPSAAAADPTLVEMPTEMPTETPSPAPSETPANTPTLLPTATPLPTNTATVTPVPDISATLTKEANLAETSVAPPPSATRTPMPPATSTPAPTATRTPTMTATPNLAATQTVAMQQLQTSVAASLTAIAPRVTEPPLALPTPTPTPTPQPTALPSPTRTPTATPTPNAAATQTADAHRIATAIAQTQTATPTVTATRMATRTPIPTATLDPLDVTLTIIAATLAALEQPAAQTPTPAPTLDPLDVTLTMIAATMQALEATTTPSP